MGALDDFIDSIPQAIDLEFDPDVEKIEQTTYNSSLIYKYFGPERRSFFSKPQLRFSQREVLNDPTEMTVRWKQAAADGLQECLTKRLAQMIPKIFGNTDLIARVIKEDFKNNGVSLPAEFESAIECFLNSDLGAQFLSRQLRQSQSLINLIVPFLFARIEADLPAIIARSTNKAGVLSLTESPLNEKMWDRYGGKGTGFAVGLI